MVPGILVFKVFEKGRTFMLYCTFCFWLWKQSWKWGWAICIGIHRISAMDQEFSTPASPIFFSIIPLTIFFRLKTPGNFGDFLGDHFARVESSGNPNLTMFILDFHVFFIFDPHKSWKSKVLQNHSKPCPLGPCPDDKAQNYVQGSLNESSVRPNPTLVF